MENCNQRSLATDNSMTEYSLTVMKVRCSDTTIQNGHENCSKTMISGKCHSRPVELATREHSKRTSEKHCISNIEKARLRI